MKRLWMVILFLLLAAWLAACGGAAPAEPPATDTPTTGAPATVAPTDAPATDAPTATPLPTAAPDVLASPSPTAGPAVLCPNVPRPALIVSTGPGFEAYDPFSGARCALPLPQTMGYLQPGGERLYFVAFDNEGSSNVVARLGPDGAIEPLEATRATGDVYYLLRFAVAGDESRLAWSRMATQSDPNALALLGSLWIGPADGSAATPIFENQTGGESRIVTPLRFTADGAALYYTWEPIGLGGAWNAFNGRYDNLYRVPVGGGAPGGVAPGGGAPEKVFDCADSGLFLCAGDFLDDGTVAYIDTDRVIHVVGPGGAPLAAIPTAGDYAGYPTFGAAGELYYSTATLPGAGTAVPMPTPGVIYTLAAPYSGAPSVVASADGLLPAAAGRPFLDASHLVVGYAFEQMWGTALLNTAGEITRLEPWPNAYLAAVWP